MLILVFANVTKVNDPKSKIDEISSNFDEGNWHSIQNNYFGISKIPPLRPAMVKEEVRSI